jgi:uncharacterized membrane protein
MLYLILSVLFFSIAALIYKQSNHLNCDRISIAVSERISAVVLMIIYVFLAGSFHPTPVVTLVASAGGITIFISRVALLASLKYGKISSSWTAVSLSVVIPTMASAIFWKEIPSGKQITGLILIPVAIFLLQEEPGEK